MVTVSHDSMYMEFRPGQIYCYANGRILPLPRPCFEQKDTVYVPIRTLAQIYAYDVAWNEDTQTATLFESAEAFLSGEAFYDYDDYMLLARVIRAESGNQSLEGKIAVGNVILNRVRSDAFPDTISDVVYDRSCGVQFTTAYNGSLNKKPTEECLVAAKLCLEGYSVTDESLYFLNPRISGSSWVCRNRRYVTTIGDHAFYSEEILFSFGKSQINQIPTQPAPPPGGAYLRPFFVQPHCCPCFHTENAVCLKKYDLFSRFYTAFCSTTLCFLRRHTWILPSGPLPASAAAICAKISASSI